MNNFFGKATSKFQRIVNYRPVIENYRPVMENYKPVMENDKPCGGKL